MNEWQSNSTFYQNTTERNWKVLYVGLPTNVMMYTTHAATDQRHLLATCTCREGSQCVSWNKWSVTLVPFVTPLPCSRRSVPVAVQVFLASNCRASTRWRSNSRQGHSPGGWRNRAGSSERTQWLVCFAFWHTQMYFTHTCVCTSHTHKCTRWHTLVNARTHARTRTHTHTHTHTVF